MVPPIVDLCIDSTSESDDSESNWSEEEVSIYETLQTFWTKISNSGPLIVLHIRLSFTRRNSKRKADAKETMTKI
jgi:hypothetical protein